jgi:hypothetical protein
VERWFRLLTDKAIRRWRLPLRPRPDRKIEEYANAHNPKGSTFVWTATAEQILEKVGRGRVALEKVINCATHH